MDWEHTVSDGCKVATSNAGYEVVEMYEDLPNGDQYQLNYEGYFVCTGSSMAGLQLYALDHARVH